MSVWAILYESDGFLHSAAWHLKFTNKLKKENIYTYIVLINSNPSCYMQLDPPHDQRTEMSIESLEKSQLIYQKYHFWFTTPFHSDK